MLGSDALYQEYLPVRQGGLELTSSNAVAATAYTGCQILTIGQVLTAASMHRLTTLLEHLPKRPLAQKLKDALRGVAEIATEEQLKDAVGISWATVAAGKEVEGRETSDLLLEVVSQASGGRSDMRVAVAMHRNPPPPDPAI